MVVHKSDATGFNPLMLTIICTFLTATGQLLIKLGVINLPNTSYLMIMIAGLAIYGLASVILIYALKNAELSLVYPVLSLGFVWVTLISYFILHETVGSFKIAGVGLIIIGISFIGRER